MRYSRNILYKNIHVKAQITGYLDYPNVFVRPLTAFIAVVSHTGAKSRYERYLNMRSLLTMRTSQNHAELYEATLNLLASIVTRASVELMSSK